MHTGAVVEVWHRSQHQQLEVREWDSGQRWLVRLAPEPEVDFGDLASWNSNVFFWTPTPLVQYRKLRLYGRPKKVPTP